MKKLEVTIKLSITLKRVVLVPGNNMTAKALEKKIEDLTLNLNLFEEDGDLSTDISVKNASVDDRVDRSLGDFLNRYFI